MSRLPRNKVPVLYTVHVHMHTIYIIHLRVLRETTCFQMNKTTTITAAAASTKSTHLNASTHAHTSQESARACTLKQE